MKSKGRVLYVACYFPPVRTPGSVRAWNTAKYLSLAGWSVTVLTPASSYWRNVDDQEQVRRSLDEFGIRVIETSHTMTWLRNDLMHVQENPISRLVHGAFRRYANKHSYDRHLGWRKEAVKACAHLKPGDIDLVLVTGGPFIDFEIAEEIAAQLQCPYVMDYRDPWTGNPHWKGRDADVRKEEKLLKNAAAVSIVSQVWAELMDERFHLGGKLRYISNGYDPADLERITAQSYDHFAIVYTGMFYPPKRVVDPLLDVLMRLREMPGLPAWKFHYYGIDNVHVEEAVKRYGLENETVLHGNVPRPEALSAVKGAGVAVIITTVDRESDRNTKGMVTSKIFESAGLGAPMLLMGPPDSAAAQALRDIGKGACFVAPDTEKIAEYIKSLMLDTAPAPGNPAIYSWENLIKEMDAMLSSCLSSGAGEARPANMATAGRG